MEGDLHLRTYIMNTGINLKNKISVNTYNSRKFKRSNLLIYNFLLKNGIFDSSFSLFF